MSGQRPEAVARVTTRGAPCPPAVHSMIRQVSIVSVGKLRVSVADRAHLIP
ncbi:hypothetical protein ATK86_2133 [Nocardia fluminea]|uniref:Uncharacterized protein n=1 Tax=Nocardia fluminea TaxID=134984 RepID=A0A2N3V840_9NOCA|nr:hypothetical protein ATK86_2133 [Nocardia fluminea]